MQETRKMSGNELLTQLSREFPQAVLSTDAAGPETVCLAVPPSYIHRICRELYGQGARFVTTVATDYISKSNKIEVNHVFSFDEEGLTCKVKTQVSAANLSLESISSIIPGANWSERECSDMLGIDFPGHPDPRRLILADDWPQEMHPLRNDFPHDHKPPSAPENAVVMKSPEPPSSVVPIGPFYPVLEEPAYFRVFVEGETVTGCDYRGFYSHRGIEKLGGSALTYNQVCFLAERI
ncbi:MAG TPA: NADH-quinone oxidoreductase subunit C [Acidobacteriota bacterium]|nr:NADH-quinone oxidoreductase subunit C [Acidobacteriota bacterium]